MKDNNTSFSGSMPEYYNRYLGPLLFEDYATDLANLTAQTDAKSVLEIAAGTGIATRQLRKALPNDAHLTASDLSAAMLDHAKAEFHNGEQVEYAVADATALPFGDEGFDAVVCQFGIMFFPDKLQGFKEAYRVLKGSGTFLFNVWDSFEYNPIMATAQNAITTKCKDAPPTFLHVPYGYHDVNDIKTLLDKAGFVSIKIETVTKTSTLPTARDVALGAVMGNPTSLQIQEQGSISVEEVVDHVEREIAHIHGDSPVSDSMQAFVFKANKPA